MKHGAFIDEKQKISFNFEGENMTAFAGDSVASALWRNNRKTLSRSFKYHRRRGILSLSGADANTLVDIDERPNVRADCELLQSGMRVRARHYCGSLEFDYFAALGFLSPFLSAGFYYKAFYKPRGAWKFWEPLIRRLAGLGVVNNAAALTHHDKVNLSCDVAVIGGGAAGMAAAIAAAKKKQKVFLLDKNQKVGGSLNWLPGGEKMREELFAALDDKKINKNITVFNNAEAVGWFADNLITATQNDRYLCIRAQKIIAATGARESPLVFADNDLPGVMLAAAALRLCYLYDLPCGRRAVIIGGGETDAIAARALRDYGVDIAAVFNINDNDSEWAKKLAGEGFVVHQKVTDLAAAGKKQVGKITATVDGKTFSYSCDSVLMNGGKIPSTEFAALGGVCFQYDDSLRTLVADDDSNLAGAAAGRLSLADAIKDGAAIINNTARPQKNKTPSPTLPVYLTGGGKKFIDYEEDLQPRDLDDAISEGFSDIQLLKRYTTAGMGPAQGKLGNFLVARYLAHRTNQSPGAVGAVSARPPAAAETLAQLAGHHFHPVKHSVLHRRHRHLSATFMNAGMWLRPAHYRDAESEASALRKSAGIIDVSTLGKIYIIGKDAAAFLEKFYCGNFQRQKVGAIRYALLLNEEGRVVDDGVAARLADDKFLLTTTTGNADEVHRQMLLWRARWRLSTAILNCTSAFAGINLAGPDSQNIMRDLVDNETAKKVADLQYSRCCEIKIFGADALLMRVGFVGEKGYEIHLPAGFARKLWDVLQPLATPCGVDAQRLLRLEKGHIIIGQDTDGLTTPLEVGMEWALGKNKDFYLGQSAVNIFRQKGMTRKLTGFVADKLWRNRLDESDLILNARGDAVGRITSVAFSPALQRVIGLGYVAPQTKKDGEEINIRINDGSLLHAVTRKLPFYDPRGDKQK